MVLAINSEHELRHSISKVYIEGVIEKLNVDLVPSSFLWHKFYYFNLHGRKAPVLT